LIIKLPLVIIRLVAQFIYVRREIIIGKLKELRIGDLVAKVPIIQGAMGIGVSLSGLAAAVANEGGIGVISGVQIGFLENDFVKKNLEANKRAMIRHIRKARELSKDGIIGINLLAAMNNYNELLMTAIEEGIDMIVTGAGLPLDLPKLVEGTKTKIAPIVSSGKAAALISKVYDKRFGRTTDVFIVEGPEAGGHLGFKRDDIENHNHKELDEILVEVLEAVKPYEEKYGVKIPIIAAGGIFTGEDIAKYMNLGAAGVQMATRFVATEECDAHMNFKNAYVVATKEDIRLVKSPVGMPGRAINNDFTKRLDKEDIPITRCYNCLIPCNPRTTPYCISDALMSSVTGENGLVFAGSNAYRVDKIMTVKALMTELVEEAEKHIL
jgi:NAD(P)H-dependent flavin oxidoreductase YrpB (nitropropane dioxygenase family)